MAAPDPPLRWEGVRRDGTYCGGVTTDKTAGELAELLYNRRYRKATIIADGEEVGGVAAKYENPRQRTWWGLA